METRILRSIFDIDADVWDRLWATSYPFVKHRFLSVLEASACTVADTGWQPAHRVVYQQGVVVAVMPAYKKTHSYGEYVFDWSWADAYVQTGRAYYPKLLCAIPFTPATGPRLGFATELSLAQRRELVANLLADIKCQLTDTGGSGIHLLFPSADSQELLSNSSLAQRFGYQFHWFNQDYRSFDDFLATFNARKRKALKRERRRVEEQGLNLKMKPAREITLDEWDLFYALYHRTYIKNSGRYGYLNRAFFANVAAAFPDQVLLACAYRDGEMIAGAMYFRDDNTLYGRYWGAKIELDGLHFEACYYQGIEYAINHNLQRFDPGAQGEHKIQRGFTPIKTCSYHWLVQPDFHAAINDFVQRESAHVENYLNQARALLPFKEGTSLVDKNYLLT